ncbi:hypothetical protein V5O48_008148 [Marasmius crinis-equi]|uniref:Uncharacterized protein n=1 Tax=Marasmius crinis-equi TaxID=585013 RepID=A0ABR3FEM2_9AGAR
MSLDLFKEALSSSTMKQHTFAPFKKVGSFESQEQQETYIRKFVPPVLLETEVGRVLLERMWYWLEGRYRLTARFLSILLECGYEQPNALLDRYIMDFAGFLPTDCPQWVLDKETEAPFRPWTNEPRVHNTELDFERLKQNLKLFEIVTDTAYEYMLTSQNRHCLGIGNDQNELVELGFARIPHFPAGSESSRRTSSRDNSKGDVVVIDERLILSACAAWLNNYGDTSKAAAGVGDEEYGQDSDEEEDVSHKGLDNGVPEVMDGGDDPQGSANAATRRKRKANNTDTFKVYQDRNISSLYYWLSKRLKAADTNGRPLEEWLLLYMILAFGTSDPTQYDPLDPPRVELGDIFDFFNAECEDIRRLKNKRARLASVHFPERYRGCGIVTEHQDAYVFFRKNLRLEACSGALGHRSNDGGNGANRLMEWVKGERREMFCFPGKEMGPDLVFCLELHDGSEEEPIISYVWVMMQTKAHGSVSLRKEDVLSGIRSVTPSALYINSRYRNLTTEEIAQLSQKDQTLADQQIARNTSILEYLDNLPDREQECGGKHSVLRVLASWPAEVIFGNHISRRGQENMPGARTQCDPDGTDNHPLARLNHKRMIELTKDFSPTNKLINLLNAYNYIRSENTQPPQKRGNEESHPNDRSKRVRLDN